MKIKRELLIKAMAQNCMSARELSSITKIAPSTISKLINTDTDKIRPKTIGLVARALEIETSELII